MRGLTSRIEQSTCVLALFAALLCFSRAQLPAYAGGSDPSASAARLTARAWNEGWRFGVDIVSFDGPLAGRYAGSFEDRLFAPQLVWQLVFGLTAALLFTRALARLPTLVDRALFAFALLVLPIGRGAYASLTILALSLWVLETESRLALLLAGALLATLALAKASLFLLALAAVATIVWCFRRARPRHVASGFAGWVCACLLALWLLAGQSLRDIAAYASSTLRLCSDFSAGAALESVEFEIQLACVLFACTVGLALLLARAPGEQRVQRARALLLVLGLCVLFKHGFTRGDAAHNAIFFAFAGVAPFLFAAPAQRAWPAFLAPLVRAFGLVLATIGLMPQFKYTPYALRDRLNAWSDEVAHNVAFVCDLGDARARCWAEREAGQRRFMLPRVQRSVDTHSVDVLGCDDDWARANGFARRPRTLVPALLALNGERALRQARGFEGVLAPQFVLLGVDPLDERWPAIDAAPALARIARDYVPVLLENQHLLLRREPRAPIDALERPAVERKLTFGESLELARFQGACQLVALDLRPTLAGRARALLYQAPPLFIELQRPDGSWLRLRIVPDLARAGVIVNPQLASVADWIAWYAGDAGQRVRALRVLPPSHAGSYAGEFSVRVIAADDLVPRPQPELRTLVEDAVFPSTYENLRTVRPPRRVRLDDREVLLVDAPSQLAFACPQGKHVLRGRYGLLPYSYLQESTDGASFSVLLEERGAERVMWERLLQPRAVDDDRGTFDLELSFENQAPARLLLRTGVGPAGDARSDWAFWGAIKIEDGVR